MAKGSAPTPKAATIMPFPITSTIEPLFKRVQDCEEPGSQMSPPPAFMPITNSTTNSKEGGGAYPILEEVPPP